MPSIEKPEKPRFPLLATLVFGGVFVIALAIMLLSAPQSLEASSPVFDVLLPLGFIVFFIGLILYSALFLRPYKEKLEDYRLSEEDFEEYRHRMIRKDKLVKFRATRKNGLSSGMECPNCGSTDIGQIFSSDKLMIGDYYGIKIGMHNECNSCKFKW
jgi:hypothetical protein